MRIEHAFLFDLDTTRVDSICQHGLARKEALDARGIELSNGRKDPGDAGATRVYEDPADFKYHTDDVRGRR
jgi:beta-phosphoglucomutase-like phosphatase (HAD superfamily)